VGLLKRGDGPVVAALQKESPSQVIVPGHRFVTQANRFSRGFLCPRCIGRLLVAERPGGEVPCQRVFRIQPGGFKEFFGATAIIVTVGGNVPDGHVHCGELCVNGARTLSELFSALHMGGI